MTHTMDQFDILHQARQYDAIDGPTEAARAIAARLWPGLGDGYVAAPEADHVALWQASPVGQRWVELVDAVRRYDRLDEDAELYGDVQTAMEAISARYHAIELTLTDGRPAGDGAAVPADPWLNPEQADTDRPF